MSSNDPEVSDVPFRNDRRYTDEELLGSPEYRSLQSAPLGTSVANRGGRRFGLNSVLADSIEVFEAISRVDG